ncbi:MAG TPA: tRNA (guanine(10)-N(2))-dimethyltransferase [Candidatus Woesearchaeota archaeon]|nr:tRNA (guanine(10)-N(2))-dimethyltransferase [Candidatus Woesearchaeota archaeon]
MSKIITEGKSSFYGFIEEIVSKKMPVFYNPLMKHNRDIAVLLISSIGFNNANIALPLEGSGIRGIRIINETPSKTISKVYFNDINPNASKLTKKNLLLNKIKKFAEISNLDANHFFNIQKISFDYIDIDPFGSPIYFIESAVRKLKSDGILAITATDTSSLCGSYPKVCLRRYGSKPIRNELMYETGIRILISAVQKIAMKYDLALIPVLSYSKDHYMRIYFKSQKSKKECDEILNLHKYLHFNPISLEFFVDNSNQNKDHQTAGPLWLGQLNNTLLLQKMHDLAKEYNDQKLLNFINRVLFEPNEYPFYYDIHSICKKLKISAPNTNEIISSLQNKNYICTKTHFLSTAIKTNASLKEIEKTLKSLSQ